MNKDLTVENTVCAHKLAGLTRWINELHEKITELRDEIADFQNAYKDLKSECAYCMRVSKEVAG